MSTTEPAVSRRGVPELEIAVPSPAGARTARAQGADRVELCSGLELGGLTPSGALVRSVVAEGLPTHVLVRCRAGDFVYDEDELRLFEQEVRDAVLAGVDGVVIGALTPTGSVDRDAVCRLVDAARGERAGVSVTFHRAIDQLTDPVSGVSALIGTGVQRILTSGGRPRAAEGVHTLARMVHVAHESGLQITAGGGVEIDDIPLLLGLGVDAVHLSAKRPVPRPAAFVPLGTRDGDDVDHFVTDAGTVRAARKAFDEFVANR